MNHETIEFLIQSDENKLFLGKKNKKNQSFHITLLLVEKHAKNL